jgi:hypothetical protein
VRGATARASASFSEIEQAVAGAEAWTASVAQTSAATNRLIGVMTERLDSLAVGTESFAAAMEQVAASSEQQSASTQEIAAAAGTLAAAAERLARLVANLKLGDAVPTTHTEELRVVAATPARQTASLAAISEAMSPSPLRPQPA